MGSGWRMVAARDNGLEPLGTHHRAYAGASGRPAKIVDDGRNERNFFAGRSDAGYADVIAVALLQRLFRFDGVHPPQVIGGSQLCLAVVNVDVYRFVRHATDKDRVVTRILEGRSKLATRIGVAPTTGQG